MVKKKKSKKIEKFLIIGSENDGFRHRYEIRKNESFRKPFLIFMEQLGFERWGLEHIFKGNPDKNEKILVSDLTDWVNNFNNKDFDVDIFWGDTKIILSIRTKKRARLIKILDKYSKFIMSNSL